jgi:hypothetical protein
MTLSDQIGEIARRILGQPNERLSTRTTLRFGTNGSVAVEISGPKAGRFYDFERAIGGGPREILRDLGGIPETDIPDWLEHEGFRVEANGATPKAKITAVHN